MQNNNCNKDIQVDRLNCHLIILIMMTVEHGYMGFDRFLPLNAVMKG